MRGIALNSLEVITLINGGADTTIRTSKRQLWKPGDLLYARESWRIHSWDQDDGQFCVEYRDKKVRLGVSPSDVDDPDGEIFREIWEESSAEAESMGRPQDGHGNYLDWEVGKSPCRWRGPPFMPRWAARIFMAVTWVGKKETKVEVLAVKHVGGFDRLEKGASSYENHKYLEDALETLLVF